MNGAFMKTNVTIQPLEFWASTASCTRVDL